MPPALSQGQDAVSVEVVALQDAATAVSLPPQRLTLGDGCGVRIFL